MADRKHRRNQAKQYAYNQTSDYKTKETKDHAYLKLDADHPITRNMVANDIARRYEKTGLRLAPAEFGLPDRSMIATFDTNQSQDATTITSPLQRGIAVHTSSSIMRDVYPVGVLVEGAEMHYSQNEVKKVFRHLRNNRNKYECVALTYDQLLDYEKQEFFKRETLSTPFVNEPLNGFTAILTTEKGDQFEIDYAPSVLGPIVSGTTMIFTPKVDYAIRIGDEILTGSLGLAHIKERLYAAGFCPFSYREPRYVRTIADMAWAYFGIQYAFSVCPERIRFVKSGVAKPKLAPSASNTTAPSKKTLNTSRIEHVVTVGEPPANPERIFMRHLDIWFVRGTDCTRKDGTKYHRKWHYKGPKRNDPEAQRRIKKYIPAEYYE